MSKIRVWIGPEGKWSEEFLGLDKVHFIKRAILFGCKTYYYDEDGSGGYVRLNGLEIDAVEIAVSKYEYNKSYVDGVLCGELNWRMLEKEFHFSIASTKILKLPILIFEKMVNEDRKKGHLSALYDAIQKDAKVPVSIPKGYSLLFKFEDE